MSELMNIWAAPVSTWSLPVKQIFISYGSYNLSRVFKSEPKCQVKFYRSTLDKNNSVMMGIFLLKALSDILYTCIKSSLYNTFYLKDSCVLFFERVSKVQPSRCFSAVTAISPSLNSQWCEESREMHSNNIWLYFVL